MFFIALPECWLMERKKLELDRLNRVPEVAGIKVVDVVHLSSVFITKRSLI